VLAEGAGEAVAGAGVPLLNPFEPPAAGRRLGLREISRQQAAGHATPADGQLTVVRQHHGHY